ncbi:MAG: hypothetical protein ACE5H4_01765 [Candidatus Thorarchaeota archaeon]
MQFLQILLDRFDSDSGNPLKRAIDALDMIEYSITYPVCNTITKEEIEEIEVRVKKLLTELNNDPVLASRIEKWWNKRSHCQDTAKKMHVNEHEHIDFLRYHERIISIRKAKVALMKHLRNEELSLEEHGLLGSKYHHS